MTFPDLAARPAGPAEAALMEDIIRTCGRDLQRRWGLTNWTGPYPFDLVRRDAGAGRLHAVTLAGEVVGTFSLGDEPDEHLDLAMYEEPHAGAAYLHRLAVLPERQGAGLGTAVMTIVEELARSRGARWLRLETYAPNTASSRFYERLGYLRRGHLRLTPGGDRVIPLDCYEKRLAP